MRKKRFLAVLLAAVMVAVLAPTGAFAAPGDGDPTKVTVILDGSVVDFEDTYARAISDRTYVPITRIIQILTGEVPEWSNAERSATFQFNGKTYKVYEAQSGIYINGVFSPFEVGPVIRDNRLMIPLRMMSDALGFGIEWENETRIVRMTSPQHLDAAAAVITVSPRAFDINPGETITALATATANTTEVKITDLAGNTVASTKSSTANGGNRQFSLSFKPAVAGKYHVYAANVNGFNTDTYYDITVTLESAIHLFDAYASPATINAGGKTNLYVETSTDVTSITYSVSSGKGSLKNTSQTSGYSDSHGKRIWSGNVYYADSDGTDRINVTARNNTGATASGSISVKVLKQEPAPEVNPQIQNCHERDGREILDPDTTTVFTIITDPGVANLEYSGNYVKGSLNELSFNVNPDGSLGWQIDLTTPNASAMKLTIKAYNNSGKLCSTWEHYFPIIVTN